jgi:hypothetical protein
MSHIQHQHAAYSALWEATGKGFTALARPTSKGFWTLFCSKKCFFEQIQCARNWSERLRSPAAKYPKILILLVFRTEKLWPSLWQGEDRTERHYWGNSHSQMTPNMHNSSLLLGCVQGWRSVLSCCMTQVNTLVKWARNHIRRLLNC